MAYWKSIASKKCPSLYVKARASLESPRLDQRSASNSRCSKTTPLARHRPSSAIPSRGDSAAAFKRPTITFTGSTASTALQQAKIESALLHDAERVREQSRSSTPVAGIVKPYEHRGSVPQAASLRFTFTQHQQNRPWSTDPTTDIDRAKLLALNMEVIELRKQVVTKDKEIQRLTRDQSRASGAYLPRARSASIMANTPADEATAKSAAEEPPALPTRRQSTSAVTRRPPLSSLSSSSNNSRPETAGGAVSDAGSGTTTATVTAIPGWSPAFPQENEIISVDSSAQITSPNSASGAGEQQPPEERKLTAIELLAERRASYIHAAAEQVCERRRSQSSAPGERIGSRVAGGEGGGERRFSATALLAERRASTVAVAAAAEVIPDLTLAATAAELSPRRGSVSALATPRRSTLAVADQAPRRASTPRFYADTSPHATERLGSKVATQAAPAEQATRRVSTTARAAGAPPHAKEPRGSKFAAAPAETRRGSITAPASAAPNCPERRPRNTAAPAEQKPRRTSTTAGAAAPTTERRGTAIAAPVESIHCEAMSVTSSAEPGVMISQEASPRPAEGSIPAVVQGDSTAATVVDAAKTDIPSSPANSS